MGEKIVGERSVEVVGDPAFAFEQAKDNWALFTFCDCAEAGEDFNQVGGKLWKFATGDGWAVQCLEQLSYVGQMLVMPDLSRTRFDSFLTLLSMD